MLSQGSDGRPYSDVSTNGCQASSSWAALHESHCLTKALLWHFGRCLQGRAFGRGRAPDRPLCAAPPASVAPCCIRWWTDGAWHCSTSNLIYGAYGHAAWGGRQPGGALSGHTLPERSVGSSLDEPSEVCHRLSDLRHAALMQRRASRHRKSPRRFPRFEGFLFIFRPFLLPLRLTRPDLYECPTNWRDCAAVPAGNHQRAACPMSATAAVKPNHSEAMKHFMLF